MQKSTKIRFIGDVHGKFNRYKRVIRDVPTSIQVGDMGVGFRKYNGKYWENPPYDSMQRGNHKYLRGNHDNLSVCRHQKDWIPDGTMHLGVYCLGGATSIDKAFRIEGYDWWADEEVSEDRLQECIKEYAELKPDYVCTHEAPESIANEILQAFNKVKFNDPSRTRVALEEMFYLHQPKEWIFGHWHHSISFKRGPTRFTCLAELEYLDLEIPNA